MVTQSPIDRLFAVIDTLDVQAVTALFAPDGRLLTADGRRAQGTEPVTQLLTEFVATLRSTTHRITAQWHPDDVWIAEIEATYELQDWLLIPAVPRAIVLREGPDGIADLRIYGAHEHPLSEHRTGDEGTRIGTRWVPPL
jgi:hypothetical protein